MKKLKYKKLNHSEKLFTVTSLGTETELFMISLGSEVKDFAYDKLKYNLSDPKKLESFLRKCFRSFWESKQTKSRIKRK